MDQGSYITDVGVARQQPVPFSHKHHVTDDGIDCRYCHTSVEVSPFAGLPPTATCMNCHSQIWTNAEILEPVRASYRTGQSLHGRVCMTCRISSISITASMSTRESGAPPVTDAWI
ncbi:MAG: cytochrome c family protein [Bryobacterales bacterium]|nr:cytochrome c family protein [Bryobacterales bacterium]